VIAGNADAQGHLGSGIYFQPDVDLDLAISEIVAATKSVRAQCSKTRRAALHV
jgi:hypothetical protein